MNLLPEPEISKINHQANFGYSKKFFGIFDQITLHCVQLGNIEQVGQSDQISQRDHF